MTTTTEAERTADILLKQALDDPKDTALWRISSDACEEAGGEADALFLRWVVEHKVKPHHSSAAYVKSVGKSWDWWRGNGILLGQRDRSKLPESLFLLLPHDGAVDPEEGWTPDHLDYREYATRRRAFEAVLEVFRKGWRPTP